MKMENTHYLPHEELKITNFPELSLVETELDDIQVYAMRTNLVMTDYTEGRKDKIDVDVEELRKHIALCRYVTDILGRAPNVCFDILMEIRAIQGALHDLLFAYNRFGNEYVGTPSVIDEAVEGGIG